ncbi:Com family DNA-binding transcriptional regulator [Chitinibacter sp. GC72]|uniref:Com family DNA-binding transcriptional regulator n=1 Tax=Chitinibacter sp. GC72 TaxID=1526917 RepID=UPI0027E51E26|nr:Com family DNA-binding transcriptional regulator [Chitinibacter sp. GC72]
MRSLAGYLSLMKGTCSMCNIRCDQCNRKLAEGSYTFLSIKCPRCGHLNQFNNQERRRAPNQGANDGSLSNRSLARR